MSNIGVKAKVRGKQRMRKSELTVPNAKPFEVRAHHLLCSICVRGGCDDPPVGRQNIDNLLKSVWEYPYLMLKITADIDVNRAHYLDVYSARQRKGLPRKYRERKADYIGRRKDLEVLRRLGIAPNTVLPAYLAYTILFDRARTLEGICASSSRASADWPECPFARKGYYERITGERGYGLKEQTELGEAMDGKGIWSILRPRTRDDMNAAKAASAKLIDNADRLFIRPNHLLCILCRADAQEPLIEDNLVEVRKRMERDPGVLVTLTEGCCMVCDPCNIYHQGENLCYGTHIKDQLRDLNILERLGLKPGATLSARELYGRVYARIGSLRDICAWGDELATAPFWSPCGGWRSDSLERARRDGLIAKAESKR